MNRHLRLLFLSQSLNLLADNLLIPVYALFILDIGGSAKIAGFLWATQALTSGILGLFVLRIKDRVNLDLYLVRLNLLIKCIAWFILIFNQSISVMFTAQVLIGMASAIGGPSFNSLVSEHLDKGRHIGEWGILQLVSNIVIGAGALASGLIASSSFVLMFTLMFALEFLSMLAVLKLKPTITAAHKGN